VVREFIKKHKIENVYLVDPTKVDPIDNLAIADLLIGENSSLMYDWIFFNKPVILVKTPVEGLESAKWALQEKFRVYTCGHTYTPGDDNINQLISDSLDKHPFEEQMAFVKDSTFYFNDGKANHRAVEWIKDQLSRMNL